MPSASKKQMLPENILENNKFDLIFDEVEEGPWLRSVMPNNGEAGSNYHLNDKK